MDIKEPWITIFTPKIKACIKYAKISIMGFLVRSTRYFCTGIHTHAHMPILHLYIRSAPSFHPPSPSSFQLVTKKANKQTKNASLMFWLFLTVQHSSCIRKKHHYRNYYKGHMDKTQGEGGGGGGRWVQLGWGGGMGRKGIQL